MGFYSDVTAFSLQRISQLVSNTETQAAKGLFQEFISILHLVQSDFRHYDCKIKNKDSWLILFVILHNEYILQAHTLFWLVQELIQGNSWFVIYQKPNWDLISPF